MKRKTINVLFLTFFLFNSLLGQENFTGLRGPYLGLNPPGMIPEIFAPEIVSTGYNERCAAFTPDGKELYYILRGAPHPVILTMKQINGQWTTPRVVSFSDMFNGDFVLSPNGNKIVFSSNRPFEKGGKPEEDYYSWIVEKSSTGWGEPKNFGPLINSKKSFAGYPSISKNGNLYFFDNREGGKGGCDIYVSKFTNGHYTEPENLGTSINTDLDEADSFIASDESYVIFCRRGEGFGGLDLFISYRKEGGGWTVAKNMGEKINSDASEICPSLSTDGKYFFFTSNRVLYKNFSEKPITYEGKIKILESPGNGSEDIYWMDARIISELKPAEIKLK